jgi:hypothetical protein
MVGSGCQTVVSDGCQLDYYVSPGGGSDDGATGTASCPFQTVTHALAYVGAPAERTNIYILGSEPTMAEARPMTIPENVVLSGPPGGITLNFDSDSDNPALRDEYEEIILAHPSSGLTNLWLQDAVINAVGAIDRSTVVKYVHYVGVSLALGVGVRASNPNGGITIGPGFRASNATLGIQSGSVHLVSGSGDDQTILDPGRPGRAAIEVQAWGSIDLEGGDAGLIAAGVQLQQLPNHGAYVNTILGLHSSVDGGVPALHVYGGSSVVLRGSWLEANRQPSVKIEYARNGRSADDRFVGWMDMGKPDAAGNNVFESNYAADIWLTFAPSAPLFAEGNTFGDAGRCSSSSPPTLTAGVPCDPNASTCPAVYDIGLPADAGASASQVIDVAGCTTQ